SSRGARTCGAGVMRWDGELTRGLTGLPHANRIGPTSGAGRRSNDQLAWRAARGAGSFSMRRIAMSVSPDLLEILRCPACKSKVELKPDGVGLKCVSCQPVYS